MQFKLAPPMNVSVEISFDSRPATLPVNRLQLSTNPDRDGFHCETISLRCEYIDDAAANWLYVCMFLNECVVGIYISWTKTMITLLMKGTR